VKGPLERGLFKLLKSEFSANYYLKTLKGEKLK
jgi:hypothetical protein